MKPAIDDKIHQGITTKAGSLLNYELHIKKKFYREKSGIRLSRAIH